VLVDADEAARLKALYAYDILDTPPEPEFDAIVRLASRLCGTRVAIISFVDLDRQWFKARVGFDRTSTTRDASICSLAMYEDEYLVIPDLTADPRTRNNPLVVDGPTIRFYAGAALRAPDGRPLGALCVIDSVPRPQGLTPEQTNSLVLLAQQTMALLDLRRAVALGDVVAADRHQPSTSVAERLRAAEARLRSAQSAARLGAFELDVMTGEVFATPEFARVFGLDAQDSYKADAIRRLVIEEDRVGASPSGALVAGQTPPTAEYRIRRQSDGAMRWVLRRGAFETDPDGQPLRLLGVVEDITDRKLAEGRIAALAQLGDDLRDAMTLSEAAEAGARLVGETLGASRAAYSRADLPGQAFVLLGGWWRSPGEPFRSPSVPFSRFPRSTARLLSGEPVVVYGLPADWPAEERAAFRAGGAEAMILLPLMGKGALDGMMFAQTTQWRAWLPEEVAFVRSVADRVHAAVAKLQAESDQRLLNLELSHRMKNTMAVVQSIAQMTLRASADPDAMQAFDGRLSALARAHEVLLDQTWATARIRGVAESAFAAHGLERVSLRGPELRLKAKSALNLAMLLHELATNASKYGALSTPEGQVELTWRVTDPERPDLARLELEWRESGGPPVAPPKRNGFGSRLLKVGIGGPADSRITYAPEGLVAEFAAPLSQVMDD
jgi:PAS domain S-box-containing protein